MDPNKLSGRYPGTVTFSTDVNWSVCRFLIEEQIPDSSRKIDPDDISIDVIAKKKLISGTKKTEKWVVGDLPNTFYCIETDVLCETPTEELYKCDICGFSSKHEQNIRIHKRRFMIIPVYMSIHNLRLIE